MVLSEAIPITMVRWVSQAQPILRKSKSTLSPTLSRKRERGLSGMSERFGVNL